MIRFIRILWILLAGAAFAVTSFNPVVRAADSAGVRQLSLKESIGLALKRNPTIRLAQMNFQSAYANNGIVGSGFYPQIQTSLTYTRATANYAPTVGIPSSASGSTENDTNYPNYGAALSLSQLLFDFGQLNAQFRSAQKNAESADADRQTAEATLILNVKQAYFGLLQAIQIEQVDEETVRQMEKHLEQAEGFFKVGSKPKFDVTKAQVDLTNARLTLIKGKNDVQIARVSLNNALGLPVESQIEPVDALKYVQSEVGLEESQKKAMERRPELMSVRLKKMSGEYSLNHARDLHYPTLSANGAYSYRNSDFPLVHNWSVGVSLNIPIFSGFQIVREVDQAEANVEALSAQEEIQIQNILLEVQQAFLNVKAADEQYGTSELVVKQAAENLDLAEGRYKAGVGTAIETTDAEVSLSNAKTTAVQALYNLNVAIAQLQKAIGMENE